MAIPTVTMDEYADLPGPTFEWVVDGLVPKPGMVVLLGETKKGKSFLALDVACAVAQRRMFLGRHTSGGRVLYLQLDTGAGVWHSRFRRLKEAGYNLTGPVMVHPEQERRPLNILHPPDREWLLELLHQENPSLVVLDVLRKIHHLNENDATEMSLVTTALETVFKGRALLIVHHLRKIPEDIQHPDPIRYSRGSSVLLADADGYWLLHGGRLVVTSREEEDQTYTVVRNDEGTWSFPELGEWTETRDKVLGLCREFPEGRHTDLARVAKERHGISRSSYYRHLQRAGSCAHSR